MIDDDLRRRLEEIDPVLASASAPSPDMNASRLRILVEEIMTTPVVAPLPPSNDAHPLDGRRRRHRHERDLPTDQRVRRRLLCPGTPVARSRHPMGREDRQSLPLLAGTPRVRVRPRELTGEVAARCERGGPFCIYFLHCHELRTGNTPKRLATSVRPNPSLHPTRYSGLRPLPRAGELKRCAMCARMGVFTLK